MPVGRPLKFQSVEELEEKIQAYFAACDPHWEDVEDWVEKKDGKGHLIKDAHGQTQYVWLKVKRKTSQVPYTITGLAVALDTSRETLLDYEDKEGFSDTIKRAKDKIHAFAEDRLFENNPTGVIFNLKNNFGWRDKSEIDHGGGDDSIKLVLEKYGLKKEDKNDREDAESVS